jgi:RimJ/RimL family protein N-acetyltransferase
MGDYMGANMFYKDAYIEHMKKNLTEYTSMFAIIEDKENKPLGIISYHTLKNNQSVAEVGMLLADPDIRGKGIGEEALRLFTDYIFNTKTLARIQYQTRVDNAAMKRIGEKIGYTVEGVLRGYWYDQGKYRDYYMIAMTKEDWLAKQIK